ncbi:MAG: tetratricopeptide repeat protein [Desulfarculus sp.]|nr:tetratricopeptide repeat protein [Desulfarculus sp.]
MKGSRLAVALGLTLSLALGLGLAVAADVTKSDQCVDKAACAEKIRFGREAFDRGQFNQAKQHFRQAVQADPASNTAWAFYDLSVMYSVAEQVKNTGSVKVSDAPTPDSLKSISPAAPAPAASVPSAPAPSAIPSIKPDEGC